MDMTLMLAGYTSWYYLMTFAGLIGVIIFYSMYKRQM